MTGEAERDHAAPARIVIVEDEVELSEIVRDYLVDEGFDVVVFASGEGVVDGIRRSLPDLLILDLMLPEVDGLSICRAIRRFSDLPVIITTARVDGVDRLLGFDTGADDYVCKPFDPVELVARVKAVLRRTGDRHQRLGHGQLHLDLDTYAASWEGTDLELTRVEFRLLDLLAKNHGQACTRRQIKNSIYDDGRYVSDRSIDSHVANLRSKLAAVVGTVNPIRSVYGVGYRLELDAGGE